MAGFLVPLGEVGAGGLGRLYANEQARSRQEQGRAGYATLIQELGKTDPRFKPFAAAIAAGAPPEEIEKQVLGIYPDLLAIQQKQTLETQRRSALQQMIGADIASGRVPKDQMPAYTQMYRMLNDPTIDVETVERNIDRLAGKVPTDIQQELNQALLESRLEPKPTAVQIFDPATGQNITKYVQPVRMPDGSWQLQDVPYAKGVSPSVGAAGSPSGSYVGGVLAPSGGGPAMPAGAMAAFPKARSERTIDALASIANARTFAENLYSDLGGAGAKGPAGILGKVGETARAYEEAGAYRLGYPVDRDEMLTDLGAAFQQLQMSALSSGNTRAYAFIRSIVFHMPHMTDSDSLKRDKLRNFIGPDGYLAVMDRNLRFGTPISDEAMRAAGNGTPVPAGASSPSSPPITPYGPTTAGELGYDASGKWYVRKGSAWVPYRTP